MAIFVQAAEATGAGNPLEQVDFRSEEREAEVVRVDDRGRPPLLQRDRGGESGEDGHADALARQGGQRCLPVQGSILATAAVYWG